MIGNLTYTGPDLYPDGTTYYWRIRLWDDSDNEGAWTNGDDYFITEGDKVQDKYYAYDAVGNLTQVIDDSDTPNHHNYVYAHDPLNRLTSASSTGLATLERKRNIR